MSRVYVSLVKQKKTKIVITEGLISGMMMLLSRFNMNTPVCI